MKKLKVLGVTAGNGVCLFPFKNAEEFEIIGNVEPRGVFYDKHQEQWEANFPNITQYRIPPVKVGRVDIIIGHPDCGDSSILRMSRAKKKGDVKANTSINLFLNMITAHQPQYWLMENLPGFLDSHSMGELQSLYPDYTILPSVKSVAAWGNSQVTRKRLVIVGVKNPSIQKFFILKEPPTGQLKYSKAFELGEHERPEICHVREPITKLTNLYYKHLRQITYSKAQKVWLNEHLGPRWPVGGKMKNQPGVSRNMLDGYPFTVRKQNRQFGTSGLVLSPREMANIQGVPRSFELVFHEGQRIYWINKARLTVTKSMPYEVGRWFMFKIVRANRYLNEISPAKNK